MATRLNMAFLAAIVIAALIQSSAAQTTHTVGDSTGWTIPQGGATFYSNWAAGKTFAVGDILVFNYQNNAHDVAEVTKQNYDSCNSASPISLNKTAPTSITLTAGEHYYICTISGHCSAGQQLAINVSSTGTTSPTPPASSSPSPSGSTGPPPPDSSARSLTITGLSATFLSIVVAFFY